MISNYNNIKDISKIIRLLRPLIFTITLFFHLLFNSIF